MIWISILSWYLENHASLNHIRWLVTLSSPFIWNWDSLFSFLFLLRYWVFFFMDTERMIVKWSSPFQQPKYSKLKTGVILINVNCGQQPICYRLPIDKRSESGTCTDLHCYWLIPKLVPFAVSYEELIDTKISSFFSILCLSKTSVDILEASIK